jgi:hypothetical protein
MYNEWFDMNPPKTLTESQNGPRDVIIMRDSDLPAEKCHTILHSIIGIVMSLGLAAVKFSGCVPWFVAQFSGISLLSYKRHIQNRFGHR